MISGLNKDAAFALCDNTLAMAGASVRQYGIARGELVENTDRLLLVDATQAAKMLGMGRTCFDANVRDYLACYQPNERVRLYPVAELVAWVAANVVKPAVA